jgi:ankyrin repeat protein
LEPIFEAVLKGERELRQVLRVNPEAYRVTIPADVLVDSIPHQLYTGDIALHLAAAALECQAAKMLLDVGSDPNAKNRRGATPLHYACDARPSSGGSRDPAAQTAIIGSLVEHGARLDETDRGGATPLHRAVRARNVSAVRTLLALGARTDGRLRARGSTPLHLAAQGTGASGTAGTLELQLQIIDLLRQFAADFRAVDDELRTPRDRATLEPVRKALSPG